MGKVDRTCDEVTGTHYHLITGNEILNVISTPAVTEVISTYGLNQRAKLQTLIKLFLPFLFKSRTKFRDSV